LSKKNVNKETITEVALEILHEKGISHLTMRNVAAKLKVKAPALYWYIKNKHELLQLLADYICSLISIPKRKDDWVEEIFELSNNIRSVLLSIPDAAEILMDTLPVTRERLLLIEKTLEIFHRANFPEDKIFFTVTYINTYVTSYVLDEQKQQKLLDEMGTEAIRQKFITSVSDISKDDAPYIHHHFKNPDSGLKNKEDFMLGLRIIIVGIQREIGE